MGNETNKDKWFKKRWGKCLIEGIAYAYFDWHKDETAVMDNVDGKCYQQAKLEEHDGVIGEPGE